MLPYFAEGRKVFVRFFYFYFLLDNFKSTHLNFRFHVFIQPGIFNSNGSIRGKRSYDVKMVSGVFILLIALSRNYAHHFIFDNHRAENKRLRHFALYHYYFLYVLLVLVDIIINEYFFFVFDAPYRKIILIIHGEKNGL